MVRLGPGRLASVALTNQTAEGGRIDLDSELASKLCWPHDFLRAGGEHLVQLLETLLGHGRERVAF